MLKSLKDAVKMVVWMMMRVLIMVVVRMLMVNKQTLVFVELLLQVKNYRLSGLFVSMPFDLEIGLLICELFWYDAF